MFVRPGAAVRVVLERVEVARLGAELERDLGHLAGRAGMVRRELAALLGLSVAAAAGGEDDRRRRRSRGSPSPQGAPAVRRPLERAERRCSAAPAAARLDASRSAVVIACPVRSPTWSSRFARGAAAAGEPVAAVFARELDAELLEPVDRRRRLAVSISTRRRSAVSCELCQTSSAWSSGESSGPSAAWIPPCAFAELHDWSDPLVARPTRAPARSADSAAASPEAPLPITSTSNELAPAPQLHSTVSPNLVH